MRECLADSLLRALTGVPIATQILEYTAGNYTGLILFAGLSYVLGGICFLFTIRLSRK